ncbi:Uncharacterised protein [Mycobacterium tuberculosis]|nr:Uncharacterised protein [Mycobacterium tuberculosis]
MFNFLTFVEKMQSCQKVFQSWIFLENCQILRLVKLLS